MRLLARAVAPSEAVVAASRGRTTSVPAGGERVFESLLSPKFLMIGIPYFGSYLFVVAATLGYAAPRSGWLWLLYFTLGLVAGWWTYLAVRGYGESHAGSFLDRNANVAEYLIPMFGSVGVILVTAALFRWRGRQDEAV